MGHGSTLVSFSLPYWPRESDEKKAFHMVREEPLSPQLIDKETGVQSLA
jgi:hypothetical protein